jgi:hypothetical protein
LTDCGVYAPTIDSGRFTTSSCDVDGEGGLIKDDYDLWCRADDLFVSADYGSCPVNVMHSLVRRTD